METPGLELLGSFGARMMWCPHFSPKSRRAEQPRRTWKTLDVSAALPTGLDSRKSASHSLSEALPFVQSNTKRLKKTAHIVNPRSLGFKGHACSQNWLVLAQFRHETSYCNQDVWLRERSAPTRCLRSFAVCWWWITVFEALCLTLSALGCPAVIRLPVFILQCTGSFS